MLAMPFARRDNFQEALGRKIAEEGSGTERQRQNAKLWADAAKVTLADSERHTPKATVKQ